MKLKFYFISSLFLLLTSCATITGVGTDNTPKPSPLVKFNSQINTQKVWSSKAGQLATLSGNAIFVVNHKGKVEALNTQTGKSFWKNDLDQPLLSAPGVSDNIVVVGGSKGDLYALNPSTGKTQWHVLLTDRIISTPVITGNKVIVKTLDGQLWVLNSTTGQTIWHYNHGAPLMVLAGGSKPLVVGNKVITGYADGKLEAYSLDQGRLIWEVQVAQPQGASDVEQMIDITANPELSGDVIYVVTYQGNIAALNANSGRFLWQQPASSYTGLALSSNNVYVTDAVGNVWAFDREDGQVVFQQKDLLHRKLTAPVIINNNIAVGDGEGYVHILNANTGETVGRIEVDKNDAITSVMNQGNDLYISTTDGLTQKYGIK